MKSFKKLFKTSFLLNNIPAESTFLLAVSGGVDSMVMLDLFRQSKRKVIVAHVNYNFRPQSIEETRVVQDYCNTYNIPLYIDSHKGYDSLHNSNVKNLQMWARDVRYAFFNSIKEHSYYDYLVTAHHKNDQVETMLLDFFNGRSYHNIIGMQPLKERHFRPLLNIEKNDIINYAITNNVSYLEDESNLRSDYNRNFLRNDIIPLLEEKFEGFSNKLINNSKRWQGIVSHYNNLLKSHFKRIFIYDDINKCYLVHIDKLLKINFPLDLIRMLLVHLNLSTKLDEEILKLSKSKDGSKIELLEYNFIKDANYLYITLKNTNNLISVFNDEKELLENTNLFTFEIINQYPEVLDHDHLYLDIEKISFPVVIRKHKIGEYFYPYGLNKKKKIAKFLIDQKISHLDRDNTFIMSSGDYIAAVLGHRIDHRFAINKNSNRILVVKKIIK